MKKRTKQRIGSICFIVLFFCMSISFEQFSFVQEGYMASLVILGRYLIQILLMMTWAYSIRYRIINKKLSKLLFVLAGLMLSWLLLRMVKYIFVPENTDLHRWIWYSYYIQITCMPVIAVMSLPYLWKTDDSPTYKNLYWLCVPAMGLSLLALTNDLHGLFFSFPQGIGLYDSIYQHEIGYYLTCVWAAVLALYFLISCTIQNTYQKNKIGMIAPFIITVVVIVGTMLYGQNIIHGDFIVFVCAMLVLVLEIEIQFGLIPSNMNYVEYFKEYTYSAWITDENLHVYFESKTQDDIPKELFEQAVNGPVEIGDYELRSFAIAGGYIFWLAHVEQLRSLIANLHDVENQLHENNDILRANLKLQRQNIQIAEQIELYTKLENHVVSQLREIQKRIADSKMHPEHTDRNLQEISVYGAYIKRDCNLLLLSLENELYEVEELKLCVEESLRALKLMNIMTSGAYHISGVMKLTNMVIAYQMIENIIEQCFTKIHAFWIDVKVEKEQLVIVIQIDTPVFVNDIDIRSLRRIRGHIVCERNGNDTRIMMRCPLGGNYVDTI